jgi:hypothetical protein
MDNRFFKSLPLLFLASRFILLLSMSVEGLRGYGDFIHFYRLGRMGLPFLDLWVEFPPLFPFLSTLLAQLAGERQHVYDYLLVILLTLFDAGNIILFARLSGRVYARGSGWLRALAYTVILIPLAYGWWFFDPISVFFMLLGLYWLLAGRDYHAGVAIGLGALTKWFPALILPLVWKLRPVKQALKISAFSVGWVILVYAGLYTASPSLTFASLSSQGSKGSWETVWALLDGNLQTGNFGPEAERFDAGAARLPRGEPARLPSWLTLIPFVVLGAWLWWKAHLQDDRGAVAFLGLTWCIFLLWSPGWSPQWVLYLLPLILLALPEREALLLSLALVLINLLEWPVMLSRGYNWGLWLTIPVRTVLIVLLAVEFWKTITVPRKAERSVVEMVKPLEIH